MSKSYKKKSDLPRSPRDFNKEDRRTVRDKLKHGEYEDLPEHYNRRLHKKDVKFD